MAIVGMHSTRYESMTSTDWQADSYQTPDLFRWQWKKAAGVGSYTKLPVAMGGHDKWAGDGGAARLGNRIEVMVG